MEWNGIVAWSMIEWNEIEWMELKGIHSFIREC